MMRRLYQWLVLIHPPQFRRRFGDEIVCIFDEAGAKAGWTLLSDALISLLRQWALRSEFPIILAALLGAALQMTLSGFVWLGAAHWTIANSFARETETQAPQEAGVFLLLLAGVIVAFVFGGTVLAVWCIRFCAHRPGRATVRALLITLAVAICLWTGPLVQAQSAAARPAFEVATVKPNPNCAGGRGGGGVPATGRLNVTCLAARDLIQIAYGMFADGLKQSPHRPQVFGGPAWIDSETFDIVAKAEDNAPVARMYGPMMQLLLEDRFALKIHKETRQLPVYALTIAKNGAKLPATAEGSCTPLDLSHPAPAGAIICGWGSVRMVKGNMVIDSHGSTVAKFAGSLVETLNRPVIDRTDLTGLFDIHLEFAADNAPADATGASIFTAVEEQLGLKLTAEKGPIEVLVIDHIERPSGN